MNQIIHRKALRAVDQAEQAEHARRDADRKEFSYELSDRPEWTIEELRVLVLDWIHRSLPRNDFERVHSLQCSPFVPTNAIERKVAETFPKGGIVVVSFRMTTTANHSHEVVKGLQIPRLMKWKDLQRTFQEHTLDLQNTVRTLQLIEAEPASYVVQ